MQDEHVPKLIPGFLVVCKACGDKGEDFARCSRCKRAIPEDAKRVPDTSAKVSGRTVVKEQQLFYSVQFSDIQFSFQGAAAAAELAKASAAAGDKQDLRGIR